jgi:hypothetical protein
MLSRLLYGIGIKSSISLILFLLTVAGLYGWTGDKNPVSSSPLMLLIPLRSIFMFCCFFPGEYVILLLNDCIAWDLYSVLVNLGWNLLFETWYELLWEIKEGLVFPWTMVGLLLARDLTWEGRLPRLNGSWDFFGFDFWWNCIILS